MFTTVTLVSASSEDKPLNQRYCGQPSDLGASLSDSSVASLSRGVNVHDRHLFLCLSTVRRRSLAPYDVGLH